MSDVNNSLYVLYNSLRNYYGPYTFFGGDKAFQAAREKIIKDIERRSNLTAGDFTESLVKNMGYIVDSHFSIGNERLQEKIMSYMYAQVSFQKNKDNKYVSENGKIVEYVEGHDNLDDLFKLSISKSGEIVYYPVVFAEKVNKKRIKAGDLTVYYTDKSKDILKEDQYETWINFEKPLVDLSYNQGIPVLYAKFMYNDEGDGIEKAMGNVFLDYAEKLKNEPILIVDLRSNAGGTSGTPVKWFMKYVGEIVSPNIVEASLYYGEEDEIKIDTSMKQDAHSLLMEAMLRDDKFVDNDQILFILTGKFTGSAAEDFVDYAHNLKNTVIVGENTSGAMLSSITYEITLPQSNIPVRFGSSLFISPDGYCEENRGFMPDLWVSGDAEEAAINLIKNMKK